jgi:hypothetical protein
MASGRRLGERRKLARSAKRSLEMYLYYLEPDYEPTGHKRDELEARCYLADARAKIFMLRKLEAELDWTKLLTRSS